MSDVVHSSSAHKKLGFTLELFRNLCKNRVIFCLSLDLEPLVSIYFAEFNTCTAQQVKQYSHLQHLIKYRRHGNNINFCNLGLLFCILDYIQLLVGHNIAYNKVFAHYFCLPYHTQQVKNFFSLTNKFSSGICKSCSEQANGYNSLLYTLERKRKLTQS